MLFNSCVPALLTLGCCNKVSPTGWLETIEAYFLTILEAAI